MNEFTLQSAIDEARRFLTAACAMQGRAVLAPERNDHPWEGCPESGAVRRASMDLTRALARMRRD